MPIHKDVNRAFFKKWSPEMSYVLGLFAADGTMIANSRGAYFIEFHLTDREVLLKIKKVLKADHKISMRNRHNPNHKMGYRLQIGSKEMFEDLTNLGFVPNKSLVLKMPSIPTRYIKHFVRGYFDGDGCVYFRQHYAKDRGKMKWSFTSRFTCGSKVFLQDLWRMLGNHVKKGSLYVKSKNSGYELVFSHLDSLALFKFMYNNLDTDLYMVRKHRLFAKALKTLYGYVGA
ncbi:MAG TPA: LAGLIDADG family homing endonuclease [Candidatus Paceibacterota bacterium]